MANIVLVDDHRFISNFYKDLIENNTLHTILGNFDNGVDAKNFIDNNKVDLIISDIRMPKGDGLYMIKSIKKTNQNVKILVVTQVYELGTVDKLVDGLADGIINKNNESVSLLDAIEDILVGKKFICSESQKILKTKSRYDKLENKTITITKSELEVLKLIVDGLSNAEIADKRYSSTQTIQTHRKNLMKKLDVNSVQELIKVAISEGYATFNV